MKLILFYQLLLLLLFVGCSKKENMGITEISFEYFIDLEVTLSNIGKDIEYIPISPDVFFASVTVIFPKNSYD